MLHISMNMKYDDIYQCSDWVACSSVRIDSSTEHCMEEEEEEAEWRYRVILWRD